MKAMLLRIGIDKGTDGALAPIFEDGSFEFIPISERVRTKEERTYKNTLGRSGKPLSSYLPKKIENRIMHFDPEFETFTYGDPTFKRKFLLNLEKEDILVFYAGLSPFQNQKHKVGLYIIGYFTIEKVIDFNKLTQREINEIQIRYLNNAHVKRDHASEDLIVVIGDKSRSKLLDSALLISQIKHDTTGKPYQAVSEEMERYLGISGGIQRSIPPRFIKNTENLNNLKHLLRI